MSRYLREQRAEVEGLKATVSQARKVQREVAVLNDVLSGIALVLAVLVVVWWVLLS